MNAFDAVVQRLQVINPVNIHTLDEKTGAPIPWYEVTGEIIRDVVICEADLTTQVQVVAGQVAHWGAHAARAKRVWEVEERNFRCWKAAQYVAALEGVDKKPSDSVIEARYRVHPEYAVWEQKVERAEEAFNVATAILDAFKAKRDMLKASIQKRSEMGSPQLTI